VYVWQPAIRIFHWVAAACVTVLFVTGFMITHPMVNAGTGGALSMGAIREVHFAAGYVFAVALVWRVFWFIRGNSFARSGFPCFWRGSWWRALIGQVREYLTYEFGAPPLGHNALAGLSYVAALFGLGAFQVVSGLALLGQSRPGGALDVLFGWTVPLLGGSFRTHMWHDLAAWGLCVFVIAHVYIVLLDAHQYRNGLIGAMFSGNKFQRLDDEEVEDRDDR